MKPVLRSTSAHLAFSSRPIAADGTLKLRFLRF
ncbi:hypothetical protein T01_6890 [Trichinella spiralis]|uniref:Uncharacterized protein n=1 Tax=Trichinella spiralis TaxID=6334 RepID=A0A0V0YZD0_TRISP|nr:hypothetical protein T01_6890 [Trichinella spiralis]